MSLRRPQGPAVTGPVQGGHVRRVQDVGEADHGAGEAPEGPGRVAPGQVEGQAPHRAQAALDQVERPRQGESARVPGQKGFLGAPGVGQQVVADGLFVARQGVALAHHPARRQLHRAHPGIKRQDLPPQAVEILAVSARLAHPHRQRGRARQGVLQGQLQALGDIPGDTGRIAPLPGQALIDDGRGGIGGEQQGQAQDQPGFQPQAAAVTGFTGEQAGKKSHRISGARRRG